MCTNHTFNEMCTTHICIYPIAGANHTTHVFRMLVDGKAAHGGSLNRWKSVNLYSFLVYSPPRETFQKLPKTFQARPTLTSYYFTPAHIHSCIILSNLFYVRASSCSMYLFQEHVLFPFPKLLVPLRDKPQSCTRARVERGRQRAGA